MRQASSASSAHSLGAADEALHGFFRTFPNFFQKKKSAGLGPHSRSELAADSRPSTRRAHGVPMAVEEDESEPVTESELEDEGKSTLGLTTAAIPGCSFIRWMVLSGGTSRISAPSGTRRGVVYSDRSDCFQLSRAIHTWILHHFFELVHLASVCHCVLASVHGCFWKNFSYHLATLFAQYLA